MRLPAVTASYRQFVAYGRYVARRLRRAKMTEQATLAQKVTAAIKAAGRALEDASEPVQDAMADRDAADDDLDTIAQDARAALAGRSGSAARQPPYTLIFPDGLTYYTSAPIDEESTRYELLVLRMTTHLPVKDAVRTKVEAGVKQGLAEHQSALQELATARNAEQVAATHLAACTAEWNKAMDQIYGAVIGKVGRSSAGRFFRPAAGGKTASKNDAGSKDGTTADKAAAGDDEENPSEKK